mgnify:CR=1 FL=1
MSTGTTTGRSSPKLPYPAPGAASQYDDYIEERVEKASSYVRLVDMASAALTILVGVVLYAFVLALIDQWLVRGGLSQGVRTTFWVAMLASLGVFVVWKIGPHLLRRVNPLYAARTIEQAEPSLKNAVLNFLLLREDHRGVPEGMYRGLEKQTAVGISRVPVETVVDRTRIIYAGYALVGILVVVVLYAIFSPKDLLPSVGRVLLPMADIAPVTRVSINDIRPGDTETTLQEHLEVSAQVTGLREEESVTLYYTTVDRQVVRRPLAMRRQGEGNLHVCRLPDDASGFGQDVTYQIEAGDATSPEFHIDVVVAPTIVVRKLRYVYPPYTGIPETTVEGVGDIKALEGTRVVVYAEGSQPMEDASIELEGPGGYTQSMRVKSPENLRASGPITLRMKATGSGKLALYESYRLRLRTPALRKNRDPIRYRIETLPDQAPVVEILAPRQPVIEVPLDGDAIIEVRGRDPDFALSQLQLVMKRQDELVLREESLLPEQGVTAGTAVREQIRFVPAEHDLKVGDVVTFRALAVDNKRPDPNRVETPGYQLRITRPSRPLDQRQRPGEDDRGEPDENRGDEKRANGGREGDDGEPGDGRGDRGDIGDFERDPDQDDFGDDRQRDGERDDDDRGDGERGDDNPSGGDDGGRDDEQEQGADEGGRNEGGDGGRGRPEAGRDGSARGEQPQGEQGRGEESPFEQGGGEDREARGGDAEPQRGEGEPQEGQPREKIQNDGEAMEEVLDHMKEKQDGQSRGGQSQDGGEPNDGPAASGDPQGGADPQPPQAGRDRGDQEQPGQDAGQQRDDGGQDQGRNGGRQEQPDGRDQPQAGEPAQQDPQGRQLEDGGQRQDGERPGERDRQDGGQQDGGQQDGGQQDGGQQDGGQQDGDQQGAADGKGGDQSSQQDGGQDRGGAQDGQGQQGPPQDGGPQAGSEPNGGQDRQTGSGDQQGSEQDREGETTGSEDGQAGKPSGQQPGSGDAPPPSEGASRERGSPDSSSASSSEQEGSDSSVSPHESDSEGESAGSQSGQGEEGGGQDSNQQGKGSPGSSTSSEEGSGQSSESGQGESGSGQGEGQGEGKGQGNEQGSGQGEGEGQGDSSGDGQGKGRGRGQGPGQGEGKGQVQGDGAGTGGDGRGGQGTAGSKQKDAGSDEANLDYARKQTDLVLDYLEDQLDQREVDQELLDRLGWSREDMERFVRRWQQLKRDGAARDGEGQNQLDEALKSLGLRRPGSRVRTGTPGENKARGLKRDNYGEPPSGYRDQFDAFLRGLSQGVGGEGGGDD